MARRLLSKRHARIRECCYKPVTRDHCARGADELNFLCGRQLRSPRPGGCRNGEQDEDGQDEGEQDQGHGSDQGRARGDQAGLPSHPVGRRDVGQDGPRHAGHHRLPGGLRGDPLREDAGDRDPRRVPGDALPRLPAALPEDPPSQVWQHGGTCHGRGLIHPRGPERSGPLIRAWKFAGPEVFKFAGGGSFNLRDRRSLNLPTLVGVLKGGRPIGMTLRACHVSGRGRPPKRTPPSSGPLPATFPISGFDRLSDVDQGEPRPDQALDAPRCEVLRDDLEALVLALVERDHDAPHVDLRLGVCDGGRRDDRSDLALDLCEGLVGLVEGDGSARCCHVRLRGGGCLSHT